MKKSILFGLVSFFFFTQVFAATYTVGLFDLSGSIMMDSLGGSGKDSPLKRNLTGLEAEIGRLSKKDFLVIWGFGKKSEVTLLKVEMPEKSGPMNQYVIQTREAAQLQFRKNLSRLGKTIDQSMTDVVGACFRASRLFLEAGSDEKPALTGKRLLLFSDMLDNETASLSLRRLNFIGSHKMFLKKFDEKNIGYPKLADVEVHLYCCFSDLKGLSTLDTEIAIRELMAFWKEFFKRSGATVKSVKTIY